MAANDGMTRASNDPSRLMTFAGLGGFRVLWVLNTSLCVVLVG
jgi:hypothetical protein